MGSSDSGIESNVDVEMLAEAHKEEQRAVADAQSTNATDARNAAVVSPSESSTSDVSANSSSRRKLQDVRNNSTTSRQNSSNDNDENDQEQQEEIDEEIIEDEEGDVEEDMEEAESGEHDDEEYRHNSSVGEESSASFDRNSQQVDCIICGVCRRQFPLSQFGNFIEHKISSGCRGNNNTKRGSTDESVTEFFSPAAYQRRRPRTLATSETKRSLSASVGREVATETDILG